MAKWVNLDDLGIGKAKREVFKNPFYADGWNAAINILEQTSGLDNVRPVKWAHWKRVRARGDFAICECSNCEKDILLEIQDDDLGTYIGAHYCPNCGANVSTVEIKKGCG